MLIEKINEKYLYLLKGGAELASENLCDKAVTLCESYRKCGFACSESVCRALADLYELDLPEDVYKVISVLAAGGIDDGRCGVVEAGLLIASNLYGMGRFRKNVTLREISVALHESFIAFYGGYQCEEIYYPTYAKYQISGLPMSGYRCAFNDGIVLIVNCLQQYIRG